VGHAIADWLDKAPANDSAGSCERPQPNLSECLDACAAGPTVVESLCRRITDPELKAACWRESLKSETRCRNWCYEAFGSW
jgi:hypothetical protein